jgi:hypothetical protein
MSTSRSSPASPTVTSFENGASRPPTPCIQKQTSGWSVGGTRVGRRTPKRSCKKLTQGSSRRGSTRARAPTLPLRPGLLSAWRSCCRRSTSRVPFALGGSVAANHL